MWNPIPKPLIAAAFLAVLGTFTTAHADVAPYAQVRLGNPVEIGARPHHIAIGSDTRTVTVHNGEDVEFDIKGREVNWHFDAIAADMTFDLADLAPGWIARGQVQVYIVAPAP
jgi:hypothetical protein